MCRPPCSIHASSRQLFVEFYPALRAAVGQLPFPAISLSGRYQPADKLLGRLLLVDLDQGSCCHLRWQLRNGD